MGLKATFDPAAKLITLTGAPVGGFVNIDVAADLYSDAKKDWLSDLNLNKYRFPFVAIGGQDLGNSIFAGSYYFLDNASGWRIRPYEADHFLELEGNLFGTDPAQGLFVPTVGGFNVVARLNTSSLTQRVVSGSGINDQDKQDIAQAVWDEDL